MGETVVVGIISLCGTLFGTLGGILASSKLTNYRIEQLENKVEKHNNLVERVYCLEGKDKLLEERLDELDKRIK